MATLTTPTYGFPYPDGTERVADGDNAMGALALALETWLKNSILAARLERTGAAQQIPHNAVTDLALNTLIREDDPGAGGGIGPQPGNGSITLAKPGWWYVAAGCQWAANVNGVRAIRLVGATYGTIASDRGSATPVGGAHSSVGTLVYISAAENVKATVEQTCGAGLDAQASAITYIAAARLPTP